MRSLQRGSRAQDRDGEEASLVVDGQRFPAVRVPQPEEPPLGPGGKLRAVAVVVWRGADELEGGGTLGEGVGRPERKHLQWDDGAEEFTEAADLFVKLPPLAGSGELVLVARGAVHPGSSRARGRRRGHQMGE